MSEFAAKYPRNEQGWIKFPRDIEYRRTLFPNKNLGSKTDVFEHPAKMPLFIVEEFVERTTKPGDRILDPFGGIGSTALAARIGRNVVLLELEPPYVEIAKEAAGILAPGGWVLENMLGDWIWMPTNDAYGSIQIITGDNRQTLMQLKPNTFDCVITSPPYSSQSVNRGGNELETEGTRGRMAAYTGSGLNLSKLNTFYWEDAMRKVWERTIALIKPGGYLCITVRDTIQAGQRDMLAAALIRQAGKFGMKPFEWHKWELPLTLRTTTNLAAGGGAVRDEDILILRKAE